MNNRALFALVIVIALLASFALLPAQAQQEVPESVPEQGLEVDPLHPTFLLLDSDGANVLESGNPVSTMQTCGTCHDTDFIAAHSVHSNVGFGLELSGDMDRAWQTGVGWYGGWNPIQYNDADMTAEAWVQTYGWRHAGGGPAAELGVEMNCFICHLDAADNDARIASLQDSQFEWASTATLASTGIVEKTAEGWVYNPAAFGDDARLLPENVLVSAPGDAACGSCHGVVDNSAQMPLEVDLPDPTQWTTLTTGQVFSPERISNSGLNIENKSELSRSWDIHAERVVECTDCHYSLNNPIFYVEPDGSRPDHLDFDPRRMEFDDYLKRPLHQFANGGSDYADAFPVFDRASRDCATCHDAQSTHTWLEYTQRHIDNIACETCHVPTVYAPALETVDWTVVTADGEPRMNFRGVDTTVEPVFISGYQPVLLPDDDGRLAPHNLVSAWYWIAGEPGEPVSRDELMAAYFEDDEYALAVLATFDADGNGRLGDDELLLDNDDKVVLITQRLTDQGLADPRITAESEAYSLHHNVTHGEWATRECSTCHAEDSRLNAAFSLSDNTPGGVEPTLIGDNLNGTLERDADGMLFFRPSLEIGENGLYILGHHSAALVDTLGPAILLLSLFGVMVHAGLRWLAARRFGTHQPAELREVYMYSIYERQWHWLQTVVIFGLIFTGMVIHKPDNFGMFSFRGVVLVHNALAALLIVNAALAAFYHLASGEIQQFLPRPQGFFGQMFAQARYYAYGIFKGEPHPFEKTRNRKMNPIQQLTYFGLLNVLLPLQVITGGLMWIAQEQPQLTNYVGGLPLLGPAHTLITWLMATFIIVHVYMTTTGHTPFANIRAMIFGWDEVEVHPAPGGD